MKRTVKRCCILITICSMLAANALSWGPEGHRVVAEIALSLLSQPVKAKIATILGDEDFVAAANWADTVRFGRPETADWHFVDIPVSAATYDAARDCQPTDGGDCAIAELARAQAVLKDSSQTAKDRTEALKFIIHIVGDIHQPLHSATNNSRADGDRGGNSVNTRLLTHTMKLHAVWDHGLIDLDDRDEADYAEGLTTDFVQTGKATDAGTVESWANEAHKLAVTVSYKYPGFKIGTIPAQKVLLTQTYANKAKPVADLQLARAGVRLARVLNETLGVP